jgi:hypothetical protein
MQQTTDDAPLVPLINDPTIRTDGGHRKQPRTYRRPPRTDYTTEYTRDEAEIEPFVPDLR